MRNFLLSKVHKEGYGMVLGQGGIERKGGIHITAFDIAVFAIALTTLASCGTLLLK